VAAVKESMKWLILGADGQLGRAMQAELFGGESFFSALSHSQLDVTDSLEIERVFRLERPDVVFNAAAWTNVDGAEQEETSARLINAYGPSLLAQACSGIGAKLVHISTDYVFSGKSNAPWDEMAPPEPVSAYGRTKAEGEQLVQDAYREGSFIVRTAWLYSPWKKNFAKTMIRMAMTEAKSIEVVNDQIGQPTSAADLSAQIHQMITRNVKPGIYHGTNSGRATWFEFARYIFELMGVNPERVVPVDSSHDQRKARRPMYSVLAHRHWIEEGMKPMRDWREALNEALPAMITAVNLGD
jgi:dTDP-4-dehydrorhamnose reductase